MVIDSNILEHCSKLDCIIDLRLFFSAEAHAFCVASTFDVENSLIGPNMLVITDELSISDGTEGSLSGS